MIKELLEEARSRGASDLHIVPDAVPMIRVDGILQTLGEEILTAEDTLMCAEELGIVDVRRQERDVAFESEGQRYRINAYLHQNAVALAIRIIPQEIPGLETLHLPEIVGRFADLKGGLVIITGPTGSGKSTTLAALVDRINALRYAHIITLEDPIEYKHTNRRGLVNQRAIGTDTANYVSGLQAALRQDPDVILLGEMRDHKTMQVALTAAETGHLVLTTMHTGDAVGAINRIIDACGEQANLVRSQLAACLQGVVAQELYPRIGGGRVAACEILIATPALRNLIRENKIHQIPNFIQTGSQFGMQNMEVAVLKLRRDGLIK